MFSVIVPTCMRPNLLRRALASVRRQRGVGYEIVVVDDGAGESGDAAGSIARRYGCRYLVTGGQGQVFARNLGIAHARERLIAFLDDDDWWEDDEHLLVLAQAIGDEAALAFASGRIVEETNGCREIAIRSSGAVAALLVDNTILVSGIAYPRALHERLGTFDATLPHYWDWDWYLRLVAAAIPMRDCGSAGVCISSRQTSVSSDNFSFARQANLAVLATKHALLPMRLKNHRQIAYEQLALDHSSDREGAALTGARVVLPAWCQTLRV